MTVKGGTAPACAACKYQRRKCSPSCPLAPYFPADQPKIFQCVHRLFGVSKVTRTLKELETKDERDDAMHSIIYEAEMWQSFPVNGCCAIITDLRHQLQLAYQELHHVCATLDACRLSEAPPPRGQFLIDENGSDIDFEAQQLRNYDEETSSSRFGGIDDFEGRWLKEYGGGGRSTEEGMCSRFSQVARVREA